MTEKLPSELKLPQKTAITAPCAWVSNASIKSTLSFRFICQSTLDKDGEFVELLWSDSRGEIIDRHKAPRDMWIDPHYNKDDRRQLPHFFKANGLYAASEPFVNVMRRFNIGRTQLFPVTLWRSNRKDRFYGYHYLLNIAEACHYFLPDQTERWRPYENPQSTYLGSMPIDPQDDDLTLAPSALTGPALWFDNTISSTLFFSDPLVRALRAEKLTSKLPLYRCRIATVN
ncbi:hypothetical protein [Castellaniella sp.]|uniref:hypothetical protein n=1 Tax=Castellaniella sp. TaxID=1955812 RepID=UPI002AFFDF0F|nr:hypothetical protein [Castellaniella sp.]